MSASPLTLAARSAQLVAAIDEASSADRPEAVYLGMGVASRTALATGDLPLDALAMMLIADRERAWRGAGRVVHLIADVHALVNPFATPAAVAAAASRLRTQIERVAEALGLPDYDVLLASECDDALHTELHAGARACTTDAYAARQAADVEWARRRFGSTVKIGWTMEPRLNVPSAGFDERYFDGVYAEIFGPLVSAVYCGPGRHLDDSPRVSPYTMLPGQQRLVVGSSPAEVARMCTSRSMRKHLRPLAAALELALELQPADELEASLVAVLDELARRSGTRR